MAKRKFKLTNEQEKELKTAYHQSREGASKLRYQAVRLYGSGYQVPEIEQITGCSRPSLMEWCRAYRQDGVEGLRDHRRGGNRAKLKSPQLEQLQQQLEDYSPRQLFGPESCTAEGEFWRVPDLVNLVKAKYGISYQSQSSYRNLFERCGFSCQRPEAHYRSRNALKVLAFEQQLEKELLDTAQEAPQTVILAGDEASLYLQATLRAVWCHRGQTPLIKLHPGRENTHFYGALNLGSGQETVLRSEEMNGDISASFLHLILQTYPDLPIILLWDRATWHQGPLIEAILRANPRLQIIYFPAGSPDLNPQEQVWKATRQAISHNHSQQKLAKLADEFEEYLKDNTFPSSLLDKYGYTQLCMFFN